MSTFKLYFNRLIAVLLLVVVIGCDEEKQGPQDFFDNDGFKVELAADKALGHGQYVLKSESGQLISMKVNVESTTQLTGFKIRKMKNLVLDPSFGSNGEVIVNTNGNTISYDFSYSTLSSDVDQLIGFTFEAVNASGAIETSVLNMQVTLSPRDNIPQKKWNLTSILHVSDKNNEVINDCEKDNAILFNQDGTLVYLYGSDTGTGSCQFDGFNLYDKWSLSEDQKTFTISYQGLFNPATTVDTYTVRSLTTDELKIELTVDLTVLGLGVETFLYIYKAGPK